MNKFEDGGGFEDLTLGESGEGSNKIEFDRAEGLFRLVAVRDGNEQPGPWMAGGYLKGRLPSQVAASEYRVAVEFIDERDPQVKH